jgi:hypothetical protein
VHFPRKPLLAILFSLSLSLSALSTSATGAKSELEKQLILTHLLEIVDKVGIVIPGEGFKNIKLGEPVEKLLRLWGRPKSVNSKGTLSYQLSFKTTIHFLVKENHIDTIAINGRVGSLAHINNGVVFGMTQGQVRALFNATPDKVKQNLLRYKSLGIELGFDSNRLTEIAIFKP